MTGRQIFELYGSYHGRRISKEHFCIPFETVVTEFKCEESGLVWYDPRPLGDGPFYAHLNETFPGYYNPESWDKLECIRLLSAKPPDWMIEVGSGDGWLLKRLREVGIEGMGIEINAEAIAICRANGLKVYSPEDPIKMPEGDGALCLLQTLEHLDRPRETIARYIDRFNPRYLHLSAPCHESLLGHTSDPLAWPPHHATSWSEKAMTRLGRDLGFDVKLTTYSPIRYSEFEWKQTREPDRKFFGLPRIPGGFVGKVIFKASRLIRRDWNMRGHSIYSVLERHR